MSGGVTSGSVAFGYLMMLFAVVQFGLAAYLLARRLPLRSHPAVRLVAVVAGALVLDAAQIAVQLALYGGLFQAQGYLVRFTTFGLLLLLGTLAVYALFECTVWTAFFCCTSAWAVQNLISATAQIIMFACDALGVVPPSGIFYDMVSMALVYPACYLLFIRKIVRRGLVSIESGGILAMYAFVLFLVIGFDVTIRTIQEVGTLSPAACLPLWFVLAGVCVFVLYTEYKILYSRRLELESACLASTLAAEKRQYELSRDTIEAINVKCHDLQRLIRSGELGGAAGALDRRALADIADEIRVYDSFIHTGNDALDVILTEKRLLCAQEGIDLTCVVDGSGLGGLVPSDVYSLFGNALDNAVEAVRQVDELEKRTISLVVRRRGGMVSVGVENYLAHPVTFVDGLPLTTKPDAANHGFGVRSMQMVAERNGGTLAASAEGGVFRLSVLLPAQDVPEPPSPVPPAAGAGPQAADTPSAASR